MTIYSDNDDDYGDEGRFFFRVMCREGIIALL